ncbi:EF-hand domain-containing family member B [Bombina bombina]|uniref:EF-hand domain-containing family member B n=1 Tax=Bombina bombina TaxID=8345 RepID=UPI00235AB572|nr:EF-hand domain-containing family member B [Bombina bombina]
MSPTNNILFSEAHKLIQSSSRAAGKVFPAGENAASCFTERDPRPLTPSVVQKFLNTRRPHPGARIIFYGKANDPKIEEQMTHGVITRPSLSAGSLINRTPKTLFQQKMIEKKESIYSSHRRTPLGKSIDEFTAVPNIKEITFRQRSNRGLSAGVIINPPKSFKEVEEEAQKGHQFYVVTHNDYNAGEIRNRKYDSSKYKKEERFGIETPHFNDGRNVAQCIRWIHDMKTIEGAKIVSKRGDDFRERFQPQLGTVLNPIADTMNVPPGHTFGILVHPEEYGVGDILHCKKPEDFLRGKDKHRANLAAVQQHLKKVNYQNFGSMVEAFQHYDKNGDSKIDKEELKNTCVQFGLVLDNDILDDLFEYCDVDKDGLINFVEFANFLNWKDKTTISKSEKKILLQGLLKPEDLTLEEGSSEKTLRTLSRRTNQVLSDYSTTSSRINAVVGGVCSTYYHTCGVPTIRTDIAPPQIRKTGDRNNYGDEPNAFGLLCPSTFTQHMVYESDFFKSRPKQEIFQIFRGTGIEISDEKLNEFWELASTKHPKGLVSVESMRNIINEMDKGVLKLTLN